MVASVKMKEMMFLDNGIIFFIVFLEADCPRLPKADGITVPLVSIHHSSSQVMLDIKTSQLSSWKTCNLLYDDSMGNC